MFILERIFTGKKADKSMIQGLSNDCLLRQKFRIEFLKGDPKVKMKTKTY